MFQDPYFKAILCDQKFWVRYMSILIMSSVQPIQLDVSHYKLLCRTYPYGRRREFCIFKEYLIKSQFQ